MFDVLLRLDFAQCALLNTPVCQSQHTQYFRTLFMSMQNDERMSQYFIDDKSSVSGKEFGCVYLYTTGDKQTSFQQDERTSFLICTMYVVYVFVKPRFLFLVFQ